MASVTEINTDEAPQPRGHYSQAVSVGDLIFVSGMMARELGDQKIVVRAFDEQMRICLNNLKTVLHASGSDLEHVAKVTVYLDDISNWDIANTIYSEFFGEHRPARAIVPTPSLPHGLSVALEAVAMKAE